MRKSGYRVLSSAAVISVFASLCLLSGCNSSDRQLRKGFVSVEKMDIHVPSAFLRTFWESPFVIPAGETLKPGTNSISITATRLSSGTVDEKVSSRLGGLYGKVILRSIPSGASVTRNDIQDEENNNAIAGKLDAASWFD